MQNGYAPSGLAGIDFHEPAERAALRERVASEGGGWRIPVPAFDPEADPHNLAGLSAGQLAMMRERGTPQPFRTATQAMRRPEPLPGVPLTLIASTFPVAGVRQLAEAGNPAFSMMTGPQWTYRELPTGHWPMLSRPRELAALLDEVAGLGGPGRRP
ncbi:hypothetical protein AGRA3207_000164 [Actinomadura graeca]|uniref:Alpha/beta hydrolase n=1 Tax=Actinomadura graeca TaxID=2750812 RepID=A0ABX8QQD4_9ACTN|nr:hypothetical protein [Actinomadura graeca]QXJ19602.1 hypothetical protein AGRA3207_000164 [Actinomadura graeca]